MDRGAYLNRAAFHPIMQFHDDWMVNVLLADGQHDGLVYAFNTEMWPEHGEFRNWARVVTRARREAVDLCRSGAVPYCTVEIFDGFDTHDLQDAVSEACYMMSDDEFRAVINR